MKTDNCSLTLFALLAVGGHAGDSWRRWGGGRGHSLRLVSLLRTSLRGLNAFDSPGMTVPFVVGFCLALQENTDENVNVLCVNGRTKPCRVD